MQATGLANRAPVTTYGLALSISYAALRNNMEVEKAAHNNLPTSSYLRKRLRNKKFYAYRVLYTRRIISVLHMIWT
jgi:hypothetical protein